MWWRARQLNFKAWNVLNVEPRSLRIAVIEKMEERVIAFVRNFVSTYIFIESDRGSQ